MTRSEYQELVEFLGPKFEKIDQRFDAVEERLTRVEVLGEDNRHRIQVVAEGVASHTETTTKEFAAVRSEIAAVRSEIAEGFKSVWSEFGVVHSDMAEGFRRMKGAPN